MNRKKAAIAQITSGLTASVIFGLLFLFIRGWFWIFPFVFAGILPIIRGGMNLLSEKVVEVDKQKRVPFNNKAYREREILKIAQKENGRVSPSMLTLKLGCSIEEAQKSLEDLVMSNTAKMEVLDDGRIDYTFPDFLPE